MKRITRQVKLSLIIPAYNEEGSIEGVLGTLDQLVKSQRLPYEIVVVDDGSRDKTLKATRYASRNGGVRVLRWYDLGMKEKVIVNAGSF
jgi:glycosyltransferase involved in cell wall biosynthesis